MIDISDGLSSVLQSKKKTFPQHVNRISSLDDPCLRRLYLARHDWNKATETDDKLQGIFETGNILEPVIERIVSEVGYATEPRFRIVGTQTTTNDKLLKDYQISGTIDGFLQTETAGKWETMGVIDIKTMSPNIYPQITGYDSLSRYSWTRRYRGQLMLYALAHNLEQCFILCVNKTNLYDMKMIDFPIDMEYCEELLKKAQTINQAIANEIPPEGINDPKECPQCKFFSHCCPKYSTGGNLKISDDGELEAVLDQIADLEPTAKEYKKLTAVRDSLLVRGQDTACGRWIVTWKQIEKHFKAQPAKDASERLEWRKTIMCS